MSLWKSSYEIAFLMSSYNSIPDKLFRVEISVRLGVNLPFRFVFLELPPLCPILPLRSHPFWMVRQQINLMKSRLHKSMRWISASALDTVRHGFVPPFSSQWIAHGVSFRYIQLSQTVDYDMHMNVAAAIMTNHVYRPKPMPRKISFCICPSPSSAPVSRQAIFCAVPHQSWWCNGCDLLILACSSDIRWGSKSSSSVSTKE